jgi:Glyoxalase-like domain
VSVELAGLVVDAADPVAVAGFWHSALGGNIDTRPDGRVVLTGAYPDLWFRPESGPKSVKNRVHPDVYASAIEPLIELGATILAEYLPTRVTLGDIEGNEFCAFWTAICPLARQRDCSRSARTATGPRNWRPGGLLGCAPGSGPGPTGSRAGCTDRPAGRS